MKLNFLQYSFLFIFIYISLNAQTATLKPTLTLVQIDNIYIPYQNGMPVPGFEKQDRQTLSLHGSWKKQRFAASDSLTLSERNEENYNSLISEAQGRHLPDYDDISWESKNIPSVENTMYPYPKVPEYYEDGIWYRYKFNTSDSLNGKFIKLIFYAVNYVADVWLNGQYLGYHEGGYTPFAFDVSGKLRSDSANVIAVRVDNPEWGKRNDIVPYYKVDWFNYSGIIHDVYLEIAEPVSILRTDVVTMDIEGNIQATVVIKNKNSINKSINAEIKIFEADINESNIHTVNTSELIGAQVSTGGVTSSEINILSDSLSLWRTNLQIPNPKLWSPKEPNLYVIKISLSENGNIIDEYSTQFGVRTVVRDGDKVLLNNNPVFLTGVARHEDHPLYGRSIPVDTIYTDLLKVKGVNANYLRTAHYPNHPQTYLVADRLGIITLEEIPVWWFDEEEPWKIQNEQRHIHEQMFKEMVYRDFNRASILFWSLCNECRDVPNRKIFIENMWSELNTKIKDGRLITQSAAADRPGPDDDSQKACDIAGWTMYYGIFHGSTPYAGTNNFLVNAKIQNPGKPILDTEFGYWSGEDYSQFNKQVTTFTETFKSFTTFSAINNQQKYNSNGFVMGVTWWCIFDWYTSGLPRGFQSMGLFSMDRSFLKPVGETLKDAYAPFFNMGNVVTGIEENINTKYPANFNLMQNYPNPFNPKTVISWQLPVSSYVVLKVFDVLGNEITTLVNEYKSIGEYEIEFDASRFASGVYFYQLKSGEFISTKKMLVLK